MGVFLAPLPVFPELLLLLPDMVDSVVLQVEVVGFVKTGNARVVSFDDCDDFLSKCEGVLLYC